MTDALHPAVEVKGLSKTHGERVVLRSFSLALRTGEAVALLGRNGSGKTTALRCIAGVLRPSTGSITVAGINPHREPAGAARAALAYAGDAPLYYSDMSVSEHLQFVIVGFGSSAQAPTAVAEEFGLSAEMDRFPDQLSAGLRQRLQLACTFLRPHTIVLLDEPTLRLDRAGRSALQARLAWETSDGTSTLFATHDIGFARRVASRAVVVSDGQVVADGPFETVMQYPLATDLGLVPGSES